jgi:sterol desaturase/sphingolipid hydroxylase (fatty acid hydroxylase superfamily)
MCELVFYPVYRYKLLEHLKVQKDQPWPWEADPAEWRQRLKTSIPLQFINTVILPVVMMLWELYSNDWHVEFSFEKSEIPSAWKMYTQIMFFLMIEDLGGFLGHSLLHWGFIYKYTHKIHHSYKSLVCISAEHGHPIDFIF